MTNLMTVEDLRATRTLPGPVVLLDVRWRLDAPDGRDAHARGHIPGAVYVDLDTELSTPGLPATAGRHPIPSLETLEAAAQRWGVNDDTTVVVYDDALLLPAARAWWLLRNAGFENVRVLDGGLAAWIAAGGEVESGDVRPEPGSVTLPGYGHREVLDIEDVQVVAREGVLLDSRAPERFRGESEPMDPRAGHIPGAVNLPAARYLRDGHLLPAEELQELFATVGAVPGARVGTTCGSGITAAHTALALEEAGITAAVYAGSWSQWSQRPELPVATGE